MLGSYELARYPTGMRGVSSRPYDPVRAETSGRQLYDTHPTQTSGSRDHKRNFLDTIRACVKSNCCSCGSDPDSDVQGRTGQSRSRSQQRRHHDRNRSRRRLERSSRSRSQPPERSRYNHGEPDHERERRGRSNRDRDRERERRGRSRGPAGPHRVQFNPMTTVYREPPAPDRGRGRPERASRDRDYRRGRSGGPRGQGPDPFAPYLAHLDPMSGLMAYGEPVVPGYPPRGATHMPAAHRYPTQASMPFEARVVQGYPPRGAIHRPAFYGPPQLPRPDQAPVVQEYQQQDLGPYAVTHMPAFYVHPQPPGGPYPGPPRQTPMDQQGVQHVRQNFEQELSPFEQGLAQAGTMSPNTRQNRMEHWTNTGLYETPTHRNLDTYQ